MTTEMMIRGEEESGAAPIRRKRKSFLLYRTMCSYDGYDSRTGSFSKV